MSGAAAPSPAHPAGPTTKQGTPHARPTGVAAVRAVIARTLTRHGDIPIYGSSQWQALDPGDPRWLAACLRAAECWRLHHEPAAVAERLDEEAAVMARRLRFASWDVAAAYREQLADPPGPWPADATVPHGFYPPAVTR